MTQQQARELILQQVRRIATSSIRKRRLKRAADSYAARVYDKEEMMALTDATLEFWLTAGRYTDQFERDFADFSRRPYSRWSIPVPRQICSPLWR